MTGGAGRARWQRWLAGAVAAIAILGGGLDTSVTRAAVSPGTDAARSRALVQAINTYFAAQRCYPRAAWAREEAGFGVPPHGVTRYSGPWPGDEVYGVFTKSFQPMDSFSRAATAYYVGVASRAEWEAKGRGSLAGFVWAAENRPVPLCGASDSEIGESGEQAAAPDVAATYAAAARVRAYAAAKGCYPPTPWASERDGFGVGPPGMSGSLGGPWPSDQIYGAFSPSFEVIDTASAVAVAHYVGVASRSRWQANGAGNVSGYLWLVSGRPVRLCESSAAPVKWFGTPQGTGPETLPRVARAILAIEVVIGGCIAALLAMAFAFLRRPAAGGIALAALLSAPVFLRFTGRTLTLGDPVAPWVYSVGQTFPLSVLAVALMLGLLLFRLFQGRLPLQPSFIGRLVLVFVCLNLGILLLGLRSQFHIENILFFGQTVGPMLAFYAGLQCIRTADAARRAASVCVIVMGTFLVALLVYTVAVYGLPALIYGGPATRLVVLPIYSAYDYFPLVIAVTYGLGLALTFQAGRSAYAFGALTAVMFVSLFLLHSKGALTTALAITAVQLAGFAARSTARRTVIAWGAAGGLAVLLVAVGLQTPTINSFRITGASRLTDPSIHSRVWDTGHSLADILAHPLLGLEYVATSIDFRGVRHVGPNPHDQYLTYALRGGIPSLGLFAAMLIAFLAHMVRLRRRAASPAVGATANMLLSVFAAVALISNFLQDNFVQPYSGCLLWFFIGVGESLFIENEKQLQQDR